MNWFLVTLIFNYSITCNAFISILPSAMHSKSRKVLPLLQLSHVLLQFSELKSVYPK